MSCIILSIHNGVLETVNIMCIYSTVVYTCKSSSISVLIHKCTRSQAPTVIAQLVLGKEDTACTSLYRTQ